MVKDGRIYTLQCHSVLDGLVADHEAMTIVKPLPMFQSLHKMVVQIRFRETETHIPDRVHIALLEQAEAEPLF